MYCGGCLPMWAILNPAFQTTNSFGGDRKCGIMLVKDGVCLALLMLNRQEHFFFSPPLAQPHGSSRCKTQQIQIEGLGPGEDWKSW